MEYQRRLLECHLGGLQNPKTPKPHGFYDDDRLFKRDLDIKFNEKRLRFQQICHGWSEYSYVGIRFWYFV